MSRTFEGSTVLITGGSRGLGRSMARAFGAAGAFVVVGYLNREEEALATLAQLRAAGGEGEVVPLDVREKASVDRCVAKLLGERPRLDVVVNNAGVARDAAFAMLDAESWDEVLGTNLTGTFNVCRAVARPMLAQRKGAIVNVASIAGQFASPGQANYAASKGGVLAFTRTIAAELAPRGVRVNALVPGLIAAGMVEKVDRRVVEQKRERIPLGRLGTADEVAQAALFLASDAASYLVGHALVVDGGLSL